MRYTQIMRQAVSVFWFLCEAERAFQRGAREAGWAMLEHAEQAIPLVEPDELFAQATAHADRVWAIASPELPRSQGLPLGGGTGP